MFNKNVLEIKKLIKNIGDLTPLVKKNRKFLFYMTIVTLLLIHFSQKLKKNNVMDLSHYNTTTTIRNLLIQKIDYLLKFFIILKNNL